MGQRRVLGQGRGQQPQGTAALAAQLPMPHEPFTDSPVLMEEEQREMTACEAAIDHLRVAFWAAGKALAVICEGRHYRSTYATFEEYVEQRWEMSRAQAYRLIEAWPLAERLGLSPIGDKRLTESQVRALLPVAKKHGEDAAFEVYQAVAEADGVRVTAQLLADAAAAVPADGAGTAEAVRTWLTSRTEDGQDGGAGNALSVRPRGIPRPSNDSSKIAVLMEAVEAVRHIADGLAQSDETESIASDLYTALAGVAALELPAQRG